MPHARRIFNESKSLPEGIAECSTRRSDMVALYLSSSRFGTITWKLEAVAQARKLSQEVGDPYLCILVASRESSILRMKGENLRSDEVLQGAMCKYIRNDGMSTLHFEDRRYNALTEAHTTPSGKSNIRRRSSENSA